MVQFLKELLLEELTHHEKFTEAAPAGTLLIGIPERTPSGETRDQECIHSGDSSKETLQRNPWKISSGEFLIVLLLGESLNKLILKECMKELFLEEPLKELFFKEPFKELLLVKLLKKLLLEKSLEKVLLVELLVKPLKKLFLKESIKKLLLQDILKEPLLEKFLKKTTPEKKTPHGEIIEGIGLLEEPQKELLL